MSVIVNPTTLAIGSPIGSGTSGSVLYVDSNGLLAQRNPGFTYDGSTLKLRLNGTANILEGGDAVGTELISINYQGRLRISGDGVYVDTASFVLNGNRAGYFIKDINGIDRVVMSMDTSNNLVMRHTSTSGNFYVGIGNPANTTGYTYLQAAGANVGQIDPSGGWTITSQASGTIPLILQMAASASVDGFQLRNSSGTPLINLSKNGYIYRNTNSFIHWAGTNNTFLGDQAGNLTLTGSSNVGIGVQALLSVTSGSLNMAIGTSALAGLSSGLYNTAIGTNAGYSISSGSSNVAIGVNSMLNSGAVGYNTALGSNTLYTSATGNYNTAVGGLALFTQNGVDGSTAVGYQALTACTTGAGNTAVGYNCLRSLTTGIQNIGIGTCLQLLTTGSNNVAVGYAALNVSTADYCVGIGTFALLGNTTGTQNTAIGYGSLQANTTGGYCIAIGTNALTSNTTAVYNVAIGVDALRSTTTGISNFACGTSALYYNITGSSNVGIGVNALGATLTSSNTGIGTAAGVTNTTGGSNTYIGANADASAGNYNTSVAIGFGALISASNVMVLGGSGANAVNVGVGLSAPTARVHAPAGTATAGSAPMKINSGTNLTTPESGAIEFDGTDFYFTI